ncbi:MAG: iron-sulfur cluster assembly protein [Patulibacter sp.]
MSTAERVAADGAGPGSEPMVADPAAVAPDARVAREHAIVRAVGRALDGVDDPCMVAAGAPTSVVALGLVDGIAVDGGRVTVEITLTEPGCPFTHGIVSEITDAVAALDGVEEVQVSPRWAPVWSEDRMDERAHARLRDARRRMTDRAA